MLVQSRNAREVYVSGWSISKLPAIRLHINFQARSTFIRIPIDKISQEAQ
jgi:hypothetical protein